MADSIQRAIMLVNLGSSNHHHHSNHRVMHYEAEGNEGKPGDWSVLEMVTPHNVATAIACARW